MIVKTGGYGSFTLLGLANLWAERGTGEVVFGKIGALNFLHSSGDPRNLVHMVTMLESGAGGKSLHWGVAGIGRFQLPLAVQALVMGGHVRVGFEDNIFYSKGELAKSNAQLVERVARIARELGREVATPKVARELLGLG